MSWKRQFLAFHFTLNLVLGTTSEGLGSASAGVDAFLSNMMGPQGKSPGRLSEQAQYNALMAEKLEDLEMSSNGLGNHNVFSHSKAVGRPQQGSIGNRNQLKTTETKLLDSNESFSMETISSTVPESEPDKRGWEGLHFNGKRSSNKRGWEGLNFNGKRGWEGLNFNGRRGLEGFPISDKRGWEGLNFHGKRAWDGLKFRGKRGWEGLNFHGKRGWEGLNFNGKRGWEGLNFNGKRGWEGLNFNGKRGLEGLPLSKRGWEGLNFNGKREYKDKEQFVENSGYDQSMNNSPISETKETLSGDNSFGFKSTSDNAKRGWEGLTRFTTCKCCEKGEFWRCCNSCRHRPRPSVRPKYAHKRDLFEDIICACCLRSNIPSCCDVCHGFKGDKSD